MSNNIKVNANNFDELMETVKKERNIINLTNFVNAKEKIKFKCLICGHEWETQAYEVIVRGTGCKKCNQPGAQNKNSMEHLINKIKEKYNLTECPYEFLTEYKTLKAPIKLKCKTCGNEFETCMNSVFSSKRVKTGFPPCPSCDYQRKYGKQKDNSNNSSSGVSISKDNYKELLKEYRGDEFEFVSEYIDKNTKIKIRHKECGHVFEMIPYDIIKRNRKCPNCNNKKTSPSIDHSAPAIITSSDEDKKKEREIAEFIDSLDNSLDIEMYIDNIIEDDTLTIYIKEKNIAIEFDSLYDHNDTIVSKNYHLEKRQKCKDKGIRLINIFEDEWELNKDLVKAKLKHILGYDTDKKIYARKCIVKEIKNASIKNTFLDNNHIQGSDKANIKLGLYYEDMLVSVMTFCKPRKSLGQTSSTTYDYELSRFASLLGYNVVGAFSKLLAYFKKNYEWNKIITYADMRWSEGNVYLKNGWTHLHDSKPNYWYTKNLVRYHRFSFRKSELKNKFPDLYKDELTEFQIMALTNYTRIWDCGNMVFSMTRK